MKISGIVTQDGSKTVEEISRLQLIAFTHVKPGGYRHSGYRLRALPTGDILGEYLVQEEAKRAYDKICDKSCQRVSPGTKRDIKIELGEMETISMVAHYD